MDVYTGLSDFGKGIEYFYFIITIIILSLLFIISLYLFYESSENVRTTATIETELSKGSYEVSYNIDGKARRGKLNGNYKIGQDVQINYDMSSGTITSYHNYSKSGMIVLGIVILGSIIAYARFYIFTKYKFLSATEGAMASANIIGNVL